MHIQNSYVRICGCRCKENRNRIPGLWSRSHSCKIFSINMMILYKMKMVCFYLDGHKFLFFLIRVRFPIFVHLLLEPADPDPVNFQIQSQIPSYFVLLLSRKPRKDSKIRTGSQKDRRRIANGWQKDSRTIWWFIILTSFCYPFTIFGRKGS